MFGLRYSLLLKSAMETYGVGGTKLAELLRERGIEDITFKRISEYTREISTPPFDKARIIMETLHYPIDDESLGESLKLNRELIKSEKEERLLSSNNDYARSIAVRIRMRNISKYDPTIETERKIIDRMLELYGTQDVSKYLENLVAKDIREHILQKEE